MSLSVVSCCTYLTTVESVQWHRDDYNARDFIQAIKDRDINRYAWVRCRGMWHKFDNGNRQDVIGWFAEMIAEYFEGHPLHRPFTVVPVPGSKIDVQSRTIPRTTMLARAIVARLGEGVTVSDVLRWNAPMPSANSQGGTRDAAALYATLALTGGVNGDRAVLVDDVFTSGGHLRACAAKLKAGGAHVLLAVCAGRSDQTHVSDAFALRHDTIGELEAGNPEL